MADLEGVFSNVCDTFKINELNYFQKEAIGIFLTKKRDIFVNLPTGCGKSLIYQALPMCFDFLNGPKQHIVVVVTPLIKLMKDQVSKLKELDVRAVSLSDISEEESQALEEGLYSVVYGTPESWLNNKRWRSMLSSDVYTSKVCAIAVDEAHVIKQWGTSNSIDMAPFRQTYSELHELRSLLSPVKVIALTATATIDTRETIMDVLLMEDPHIVSEKPNKPNIAYSVHYMQEDESLEEYFDWIVEEFLKERENTPRTIIYCQTIEQCSLLYATLRFLLGKDFYYDDNPRNVALEMLHSCTPKSNKETILHEFQSENSRLRVLIANIAFGMGIGCKGVCRVIHFGPPNNVDAYIQETGRAGRDGKQSIAHIVYQGLMLKHVDRHIKKYVASKSCRRKNLLKHFDNCSDVDSVQPLHLCCDNCAVECQCGSIDCKELTQFPESSKSNPNTVHSRAVTPGQRQMLKMNLVHYHKTLVNQLVTKVKANELKILTPPQFLLGFSEVQIAQVLNNCEVLFTLQDIVKKWRYGTF